MYRFDIILEHMAQSHLVTPWQFPLIIPPLPWESLPCSGVPLTYLESLLWVWCDLCPLWSQVACKLTSPLLFPSPFPFPAPNSSPFQLCALLRRHHDIDFIMSDTRIMFITFDITYFLLSWFPIWHNVLLNVLTVDVLSCDVFYLHVFLWIDLSDAT